MSGTLLLEAVTAKSGGHYSGFKTILRKKSITIFVNNFLLQVCNM
jgi:hypothetical protein